MKRVPLALLVGSLAALLLSACTDDPAPPAGSPTVASTAPPTSPPGGTPEPTTPVTLRELWRVDYDGDSGYVLAAADESVVIAVSGPPYPGLDLGEPRTISAFEPDDGAERWTIDLECAPFQPAVRDGVVYFACDDGVIRALDTSDGSTVWTASPGIAAFYPVLAEGLLIYGEGDPDEHYYLSGADGFIFPTGQVIALDAATGDEVWRTTMEGAEAVYVAVSGEDAFLAVPRNDGDDEIISVGVASGDESWRTPIISARGLPFASDSQVVVGGNAVTALSRSDGSILWTSAVDGTSLSPVVADGVVTAGTNVHSNYGLSAADGAEVWEQGYCDCPYWAQPFGEFVLVSGTGFALLQPATGTLVGGAESAGNSYPPAIVGPRIYGPSQRALVALELP